MRKLFLLLPALVLSLITNAAVININTETADALRKALNSATDGDIIEMAAGTYVESPENWIAFTGKNIIVRAAEGAEVILQPQVSIRLKDGATAEFIGIKFDCGHLSDVNAYSDIIFPADATDGKNIILRNCEFYGWTQNNAIIYSASSNTLNSLIIENCYFHDVTKSCVFLENTTNAVDVQITNSTFANIATVTGSYWAGVIDMRSTTGSLLVDHCTFYNVQAMSTDYAAIGKIGSGTTAVVSNCIFAMPTSTSGVRTIRDAVTANNCLVFNYSSDSGYGMQSNVTKNNCTIADPLFTNAATGDFSFANNWATMAISPVCGAATDGSDLGDPRWYTEPVLPETDFSTPYQFVGSKAMIAGNIWYDGTNDYLYYNDKSECGTATWKIRATETCVLQATLNMNPATTTGHQFKVEVLDADGNSVAEVAEASSVSAAGDIVLPGSISLAAGDYTIKLYNLQGWSSAKIDGLTFAYVGGAIQAMPGTTNINDAWFSANGTRADGKITYSSISSGCWAKWNINVASAGTYNVIVNISGQYGHDYTVEFLKEGESTPIIVTKGVIDYTNDPTLYANELGSVTLEAANYEMKVLNSVGDAALHSVTLSYAGGAAIDLSKTTPASLLANADAILSDDWTIEDGKITHVESKALTGWAKWNVNCADYANYNVTVNISSDNGHGVRVEVFEDEAQPAIYTMDEPSSGKYHTGDLALDLGNILLADREYVVKVSNTVSSSHVQIASIVITYLNGAQATLPATFNFEDGMLSEKAHVTAGELWFNTIGDSNPVGQWAKWNVKVAEAGTFLFGMNVSSTNGQSYKISILDGETEMDAFESGSVGNGDKTVKHYFNLAAGNYTVKLENTYPWSQGHVVSLVVTQPSLLTIDEMAETNAVIHDNLRNGTHDIQIIRSIVAGMYNSICLPFDVNSTQLKAIFGADVELLQMASATLNGDELILNFDDAASIYRGTPYLIKTTKAVVNPIFTDVEIKAEEASATSGANANFIGNFIKGTIPAGENNLFLGTNDKLYFSEEATTIKGMRAYFQVHSVPAGAPIRHARIVTQGNVATALDLVNDNNKTIKTIENGQLILIRDGKRYNVMGIRF